LHSRRRLLPALGFANAGCDDSDGCDPATDVGCTTTTMGFSTTTVVETTTTVFPPSTVSTTSTSTTSTSNTTTTTTAPDVRACCLVAGGCAVLPENECVREGGDWMVADPDCGIDDEVCRSPPFPGSYSITVAVLDATDLAALQFEIDYSGIDGEFFGSGANVACSRLDQGSGFVAINDDDEARVLRYALAVLGSLNGSLDLLGCLYESWEAPVAADFVVTVTDASRPDFSPIVPPPTLTVTVTPQ
jgi:hypothetical protein